MGSRGLVKAWADPAWILTTFWSSVQTNNIGYSIFGISTAYLHQQEEAIFKVKERRSFLLLVVSLFVFVV